MTKTLASDEPDEPRTLVAALAQYFDAYIAHAKISQSAFGLECVGDGGFMTRLRQGKVTLRNAARAFAYVEAQAAREAAESAPKPTAAPKQGGQPEGSKSWAFTGHRTAAQVMADEAAHEAEARQRFETLPANKFLAALRQSGQRFQDDPEAAQPERKFTAHRPTSRTTGGVSSYAF